MNEIIDHLFTTVCGNFYNFRCEYLRHKSAIGVDLEFIKAARSSKLVYASSEQFSEFECTICFDDHDKNKKFLMFETIEEAAIKKCSLNYFFLWKEFFALKNGRPSKVSLNCLIEQFFASGASQGRLDMLDAIKRQSVRPDVFVISLGSLDGTLKKARDFRSGRQRGKGELSSEIYNLMKRHLLIFGQIPTNDQIIGYLLDMDLIENIDDVVADKADKIQLKSGSSITNKRFLNMLSENRTEVKKNYSHSRYHETREKTTSRNP